MAIIQAKRMCFLTKVGFETPAVLMSTKIQMISVRSFFFRRIKANIPIITLNDDKEIDVKCGDECETETGLEKEFESIVSPDLRDKIYEAISSRLGSDEDETKPNPANDGNREIESNVEKRSSEVKKDEVRVRSIEVELSAEEEQKRSSLYTLIVPFDEENESY